MTPGGKMPPYLRVCMQCMNLIKIIVRNGVQDQPLCQQMRALHYWLILPCHLHLQGWLLARLPCSAAAARHLRTPPRRGCWKLAQVPDPRDPRGIWCRTAGGAADEL